MPEPPWGLFVQPDQRSCGAASLVVARFLGDPEYRSLLEGGSLTSPRTVAGDAALRQRFAAEALKVHERVTGLTGAGGRLQVPWPRKLGTPPWAVARELSDTPAADGSRTPYSWHPARLDRPRAYQRLIDSVRAGRVAGLFIGSRWLPRHIVLAVGADESTLRVYDPARGRVSPLDRVAFTGSRIAIAGWDHAWMVVTPD